MVDALPLAFLGTSEIIVIAIVGLLLFGGDLPKLLRDLGQIWVKLRRSVNEFKREAGLDQTVEEIRRVTDFRLEEPRWRREMDHAAGPARHEPPVDAQAAAAEPVSAPAAESGASEAAGSAPAADSTPAVETVPPAEIAPAEAAPSDAAAAPPPK